MTLANIETGEIVEQPNLWLDDAVGHHVAGDLTADEALAVTAKIKAYAGTAWLLLYAAHERKAYKALGYKSWEAYVRAEFDIGRSHSYRLLSQAKVVLEIAEMSPMGDIPNERQARPLAELDDPEDRAEVWTEATEGADAEGRPVTAKDVEAAVEKRTERETRSVTTETVPTTAGDEVTETATSSVTSEPDNSDAMAEATERIAGSDVAYRESFSSALVKAGTLLRLDPERCAAVTLVEDRTSDEQFVKEARTWLDRFDKALHSNHLRSV
jgi:hypothetical protein